MKVIAFANQKGGTGKTTLCGHCAVQAELQGLGPVFMIDLDRQGSLTRWWNSRKADTPEMATCETPANLPGVLEALKAAGVQYVMIDTPPSVLESVAHVLKHADLIVVPLYPSPHDMHAVGETIDIADEAHVPFVFAMNTADKRAKLTAETAVQLSQHGAIARTPINFRQVYRASMSDGRTVQEVRPATDPAVQEVTDLWAFIHGRLHPTKKTAARAVNH